MTRHAFRSLARPSAAAALMAAAAFPPAAVAQDRDAELEQLRQAVEQLQSRIDQLEEQQEDQVRSAAAPENTVRGGDIPGSFKLPGSDTSVLIGGYVKADATYDLDQGLGDLFNAASIGTGADDTGDERFNAHARQTRIFFRTSTPSDWGDVTTHLEFDFFGERANDILSNSHEPRLRHANVEVGPVRAGQYWTLFMPIESYPATTDFFGPSGIPFIRQAQLRYTHQVNEKLTIAGSLENSEFTGRTADDELTSETLTDDFGVNAGIDKAPDVVAAATWRDDWGLVKLAGVGRLLSSPVSNDEEFGWGANLSSALRLWEGSRITGSLTYGDGVGRYIINGGANDAFIEADGDIETIGAFGAAASVSQKLTDSLTGSLTYGHYEVDDRFASDDVKRLQTVHASLFYDLTDRVTLMGEVIYGRREDDDGASGDNTRLQSAVRVSF